ncbi:DNA polymerase III subunits gamma and tau [Caenispirillum salinarum AK4]|uniref:DNA polymerase III subunit gamma/tau n=1 Tax=Caenispirillum salinarum AK4 TaxID=1238182 RepID=K9H4M2_9PROT|nr:DNA polymerase III subunit gamma/tau [Caenispirillum salinarum]EKV32522.1 DNA polymerase III subunits gamma and tau [Caenispirillum salinarum AK4]
MTDTPLPDSKTAAPAAYRVLARKYRPTDFTTLIGQDALVRTLSNAIESGRLAQAYVLTGVRGVGKTTTARIIARALNCIGEDGTGGPTVAPCGVCEHCRAISEDRHVDVLEMDAASRTGVNDIREILEGVRYRPTSARYKIYIVDEVHMLSTAAFNALLKTLEEPPEHVKFIFATTEIRKVPVTVLSRCQRFDLRRVEASTLANHFAAIAEREGADIEPAALSMVARAADGSVRDGLSLLDQAIAHGGGTVTEQQVRDMLGLADRAVVFDLFEAAMGGDVSQALSIIGEQYTAGAEPTVILQDMLELTHWLTRLKVAPDGADDPMVSESERVRGRDMAGRLHMAVLTRTWQMILKGLTEARSAPSPLQAVEMALIRLTYAANLPSPAEAVEKLRQQGAAPQPQGQGQPPRPPQGPAPSGGGGGGGQPAGAPPGRPQTVHAPQAPSGAPTASLAAARQPELDYDPYAGAQYEPVYEPDFDPAPAPAAPPEQAEAPRGPAFAPVPRDFPGVVKLFKDNRESVIAGYLEASVHLVRYEPDAAPPRLEFRTQAGVPVDFAQRVGKKLRDYTDARWMVTVNTTEQGEPTLKDQTRATVAAHPLIEAALRGLPGTKIDLIRPAKRAVEEAPAPAPDAEDASTDNPGDDDA